MIYVELYEPTSVDRLVTRYRDYLFREAVDTHKNVIEAIIVFIKKVEVYINVLLKARKDRK